MGSQILGWADVVMDTAEVVALGAVLWSLLRVDRKIAAVLRVIRRIDRKTAEPTKSPHRRQAELNEAPPELTGDRQPELDRMVAD
jgi:hypothetical protein